MSEKQRSKAVSDTIQEILAFVEERNVPEDVFLQAIAELWVINGINYFGEERFAQYASDTINEEILRERARDRQ